MSADENINNLSSAVKKRGKRSAASIAKRKKNYRERQLGFLKRQRIELKGKLEAAEEELTAVKLQVSLITNRKHPNSRVSK